MGMISDDELAAYADEALPQFELDQLNGGLDAELLSRVAQYLRLSLQRINELPSDDPLWVSTNRRPTPFKAQEWFRARLADDPKDLEARWVVISYTLAWCQYGAEELLPPLVRENVTHVRWLVGRVTGSHPHPAPTRPTLCEGSCGRLSTNRPCATSRTWGMKTSGEPPGLRSPCSTERRSRTRSRHIDRLRDQLVTTGRFSP